MKHGARTTKRGLEFFEEGDIIANHADNANKPAERDN